MQERSQKPTAIFPTDEVQEQVCKCCGISYPLTTDYYYRSNRKSGFQIVCKKCKSEIDRKYREEHAEQCKERRKRYYEEHKEQHAAYSKAYREFHQEEIIERRHKYYTENKEQILAKNHAYRADNLDKIRGRTRQYYLEHREEKLAKDKAYREANKERVNERARKYYHENKEIMAKKSAEYRAKNRDVIIEKKKAHYQKNKEYYDEYHRKYKEEHRDEINAFFRKYYHDRKNADPIFKLAYQVRGTIQDSFRHRGYRKDTNAAELTGLCSADLTDYLIETFRNNYGREWDGVEPVHIDHIIPLATAESIDDVKRLCHYTNLQLLTAEDNLRKNAKLDYQLTT